jgi:hypothetical protein
MLGKLMLDYCCAHSLAGLAEEPTNMDAPREGKHGHRITKR